MKTAVYPGSFDPITNGHLDIIKRAARIFDHVVVSVLVNQSKSPMFSLEERKALIEDATADLPNVRVDSFEGLLVDYVIKNNYSFVVKGLRAISDFESEFQMASMNRILREDVETVFMMTGIEYAYLSSSMVKEVFKFGGEIEKLVPPSVIKAMVAKTVDLK